MTLDGFENDTTARIVAVDWASLAEGEAKRLRALGVDEGAEVSVVHRGVFGTRDPLALRIGRMSNLESVVWCQEEPRNNGAWLFARERIEASLESAGKDARMLCYAGREEAASPATGLAKRHQAQQDALVTIALGLADGGEAKRALKKTELAEKKV